MEPNKNIKLLKHKETGNIKSHTIYQWENPDDYIEIDNFIFRDTLKYYKRGITKDASFEMISTTTGKQYHFSITEFMKIFKHKAWNGDRVTGNWTFKKHGKMFSTIYIKDKIVNPADWLDAKVFLDKKMQEHIDEFGVEFDTNSKIADIMAEYTILKTLQ